MTKTKVIALDVQPKDRIFKIQRRILKKMGYWPDKSTPRYQTVIGTIFTNSLAMIQVSSMLYFEYLNITDFTLVAYSVSEMLKWLIDITKFGMLVYNWNTYKVLIEDFREMWQRASTFKFSDWNETQLKTVRDTDFICLIYQFWFSLGGSYVFLSPTIYHVIYKSLFLGLHLEPTDLYPPVAVA